mgnify:CR=1 FL=1
MILCGSIKQSFETDYVPVGIKVTFCTDVKNILFEMKFDVSFSHLIIVLIQ